MLVVETNAKIRRRHSGEGASIRSIARDLGVSRNTVRELAREGTSPTKLRKFAEVRDRARPQGWGRYGDNPDLCFRQLPGGSRLRGRHFDKGYHGRHLRLHRAPRTRRGPFPRASVRR